MKQAMKRHNTMADADNWEVHHSGNTFFTNPASTRIAKVKKGRASNFNQASRVGKVYPLKSYTIHPNVPIKGAHIVDSYSAGNPHAHAATTARHDHERWLKHYA